jgi:CBS domain-containing protein
VPLTAKDYCSRKPVTVDPAIDVQSAVRLMDEENVGCVIVAERGLPVGILTDRDAALLVLTRRLDASIVPVREVMHQPVQTIDSEAPVSWALALLRSSQLRRLPVVNAKGTVVGVLALDDLLQVLATEVGDLAEVIRQQVQAGAATTKSQS